MIQLPDETIREFATRLKSCSLDCDFVCPYEQSHDLTDYHLINRIRGGVFDKKLQHELLTNSETVNSVSSIISFCENYEVSKKDTKKLTSGSSGHSSMSISNIDIAAISEDEIIAAVSSYRKAKSQAKIKPDAPKEEETCSACGYVHQTEGRCPAKG